MPNYITSLNQMIAVRCAKIPRGVLFGQNINAGTFISGLSKNLTVAEGGRIMNNANCENTLCGVGFGMMLGGVHSVYFVKQLDFMLLGLDHFVNTFNFIRCSRDPKTLGSFQIILLVCDQGLQGPQSSFDSYGDFCSIARIPCYSLTNSQDSADILDTQLAVPGFRMFALSSRLCKTEFLSLQKVYRSDDCSVFQYSEGRDATIVGFNFSLYEGHQLLQKMQAQGMTASLFSANYAPEPSWDRIIESVAKTRRLVVLDDSKSVHLPCYKLIDAIHQSGVTFRRAVVTRQEIDFGMTDDRFLVDYDAFLTSLREPAPVR